MATFVHNEPTSLGTLQELQLPQGLYAQLEQGIPPAFDVRHDPRQGLIAGHHNHSKRHWRGMSEPGRARPDVVETDNPQQTYRDYRLTHSRRSDGRQGQRPSTWILPGRADTAPSSPSTDHTGRLGWTAARDCHPRCKIRTAS